MKNEDKYCVIMAGGVGSRFWPMSRTSQPKQFLDILGTGKSFIRQTYERFAKFIPDANFLVVTNNSYKTEVLRQIPELGLDQVLCEPLGRNTAPCIAYAAHRLKAMNPNSSMIVTPSDHYITNEEEFVAIMEQGLSFVEKNDTLVTIGIHPDRPDTGYGYIQIEPPISENSICKVKTFTEKPTLEVAKAFVESGEFFWNSGIFIWRTESIIKAFKEYLPEIDTLFSSIESTYGTTLEREAISKIYPECRNISIDYGVMEKADNVHVICADFGWSDIGTWGSLYAYSSKTEDNNVISGDVMTYNTTGTIIKMPEDKLVVVEGLEGYIVVERDNVLLICRRNNEQNIKQFVEDVKLNKGVGYV